MPVSTVVVAEDNEAIRELLRHHLECEGFSVLAVGDGQSAVRAARGRADLLILDIGLPGMDGFDVTRKLRAEGSTFPILMLTARLDEIDRVIGFELGADDYVTKPFSPREVVARVKAVLRRSGRQYASRAVLLDFGRLVIDEAAREARIDGVDVKLMPREFSLLLELANNLGIALSRERLLAKVWGINFDGDERTVDVHVRRLRAKIEKVASRPTCVLTVHGFGYKFARP